MGATLLLALCLPREGQAQGPAPARPAIYEFGRKLCPICHQMEEVLNGLQNRYADQFTLRLLYIDEDIKLFRQFNIAIVPTQVFLDASGKEVFRHEGLFPREKLEQKLRELNFVRE
jgi:thioredoxin 1